MANVTGLITVNGKDILEVDADPSAGGGTAAPMGSLAMFDTGSAGQLWLKTGAAATAWTLMDSNANDWSLAGNTLAGTELFGSVNDQDVKFYRNNLELMRMVGTTAAVQGLLIGLSASLGGRLQLSPTAAGDDIIKEIFGTSNQIISVSKMYRVTTTSTGTATFAIAIPDDYSALIETKAIAKQTGGSAGTAGDSAAYIRTLSAKNIAATASIDKTQTDFTYEINGALDFTSAPSGATIVYTAQGALNRNFSWGIHTQLLLVTT